MTDSNARPQNPKRDSGSTLIEVVAALVITALFVAAAGPVARESARRAREMADRADLLATLRTLLIARPTERIASGSTEGTANGTVWTLTRRTVAEAPSPDQELPAWRPVIVTLSARAADGTSMTLETIRLEKVAP